MMMPLSSFPVFQLEPLRTRRAALGALRDLSLRGVSCDGASLFDGPNESASGEIPSLREERLFKM